MDTTQAIYFLLTSLARELPQFVVIGIGIFICFSKLKQYPKAGKTALGGLFILLIAHLFGLIFSLLTIYLPVWYRDSYKTIGYIGFAVGVLFSLISAAGLGLLIYAVWSERKN